MLTCVWFIVVVALSVCLVLVLGEERANGSDGEEGGKVSGRGVSDCDPRLCPITAARLSTNECRRRRVWGASKERAAMGCEQSGREPSGLNVLTQVRVRGSKAVVLVEGTDLCIS